jgi:hypothetical protein
MDDQELAELEQQADANAMAWLDEWMPRWREGNPPTTNQIYVTITKQDEEEDDDMMSDDSSDSDDDDDEDDEDEDGDDEGYF